MITQLSALTALDSPTKYTFKSQVPQSFLSGAEPSNHLHNNLQSTPTPERETIKHTLIGSSRAVMGTIHVLHQLGYAQVGDWSPLVSSPTHPGEVMSILVRNITVQ
ncbi:hypothetical protein [Brunnivagina elsteri]|uniref:hypothetical protein n=1 Tax=Brunnivagina elsteri TaxID=1247191 RepID=UPI001FE546E8|nr:hypothetical protein [Calothrix elsteri]